MSKIPRFFALLVGLIVTASPVAAEEIDVRETYALSIAGIEIGEASLKLQSGGGKYAIAIDGGYRFLFWSGAAEMESQGLRDAGAFSPRSYRSRLVSSTREVTTAIDFDGLKVSRADFRSEPPLDPEEFGDRVPVRDAHLIGASDPISAFMIPAASASEACSGSLQLFSGVSRFDLTLEQAVIEDGLAYCQSIYQPISGHRRESGEVDRLKDDGLELVLFEIAPSLWAPQRIGFRTRFGTLALERTAEN